jgi:hypothetical protein
MYTKFLVRKPFRKLRCRWEDNIRWDFKETGWKGVDWIHMAQDKDERWAHINISSIKGGKFLD